jgi:methyl-accepting chemotaxis protein
MLTDLDTLRQRGIAMITGIAWLSTLVLALLAATHDAASGWTSFFVGCAINVVPSYCVARHHSDLGARLSVAIAMALHPALLLFAMQNNPWQSDMHMYFFVGLATLTVLCDWRPLLLASGLIATHHLSLSLLAPGWVFENGGGIDRVLIHALAVVLQCGTLGYIATRLRWMITEQAKARATSEALAAEHEALAAEARAALANTRKLEQAAAHERARREAAEAEAARASREQVLKLANEFERSVAGVASAVGGAAALLEGSARSLNGLARDTGRQAAEVASAAVQASEAARSVAGGVGTLSRSIGSIAVNINQAAELSGLAHSRSTAGDRAVRALGLRTADVADFANSISGIASKTNLLALNATIEAARAGESGRGFAIVAQEVKMLAGQAAHATGQISGLIAGMNAGAGEAEQSFQHVFAAITELNETAAAIREAVDEQSLAAHVIERNADEAATGVDAMAQRVAAVSNAADAAERLSDEVKGAASSLLRHAETLQAAADSFVTNLRAA